MNLNVVLRAELHGLIKKSLPDQLFTALHNPNSPIRDRFIRFLALSYADWLSTQNDIDSENIKRQWTNALSMPAQIYPWPTTNTNNNTNTGYEKEKEKEKEREREKEKEKENGNIISLNESNGIRNISTNNTNATNIHNDNKNGNNNNNSNNNNNNNNNNNSNGSSNNGSNTKPVVIKHNDMNGNFKPFNPRSSLTQFEQSLTKNNNNNMYSTNITPNNNYGKNTSISLREKKPLESFAHLTDKDDPLSTDEGFPGRLPSPTSPTNIIGTSLYHNGSSPNGSPRQSPQASPRSISHSADESSTVEEGVLEDLTMEQQSVIRAQLPLLTDIASIDKRNDALIAKLKLCCVKFDFKSTNTWQAKGIEKKKTMLTEILEYIAKFAWHSEPVLQQCIATISKNLFRSLPRRKRQLEGEDEVYEDPSWPHLQLIYELTLRIVICTDIDKKVMRRYLEGKFVNSMIELFVSDDMREREYLKTILHRIYGRFMQLRECIRVSIANACHRTVYEGDRSENGIAEFLEIFCSIIHGFSIPVKEEHKDFLRNVLIPLHKCRRLDKFHEQLVACCVQFVFKDPSIAPMILGGLLRFWPIQSPTKEEMFIAEVVNVINAMVNHKNGFSMQPHRNILLAIIDQLVKCMQSKHHSVAERALLVWSEDAIELLVDMDKKTIWPKIITGFIENKNHWNEQLKECNEEAMDGFKARDQNAFNKIMEECLKNKTPQNGFNKSWNEKKKRKQHQWSVIRTLATQRSYQKMSTQKQ